MSGNSATRGSIRPIEGGRRSVLLFRVRDIALVSSIVAATVLSVRPLQADPPARPKHAARLVLQPFDGDPIVLKVYGQRVKEDGRLRFVGSIDRRDGEVLAHWNLVCDPNPHGGASIEGVYEIVGPFDGSISLELQLDPIVEGLVALKTNAMMRAQTEEAGVVIALPAGEAAWSVLVDGRPAVRHGQGPFSLERRSPGVTNPRTWQSGEEEYDEPTVLKEARDTLAIRARCILEEGRSVMFNGRVELVGDPVNFRFREELDSETADSRIPRRPGSISIVVPGAGNGVRRGSGSPNKQPAVIRPTKREGD